MIALVTGAGNPRGIGAACVRALAERGATVAFTVMPGETAPDDLPGTAFTTDLSEAVAPERLMDAVTERIGHPSVLVNNAAHSTRDGFEALDAATIDAHYAVNVRAPMLLSALLARAGRPGRIVNLVSGQFLGPMPGELAYTRQQGRAGGLHAPARRPRSPTSASPSTPSAPAPTTPAGSTTTCAPSCSRASPWAGSGRPEDAAALVAWLCSEEAGWVTGQVIHSEGGFLR